MILIHLIVPRAAPGMANNAQKSTSYSMKSHHRATRNCLTLLDCAFVCAADQSLPALSCGWAGKPKQSLQQQLPHIPAEQLPPRLPSQGAGTELFSWRLHPTPARNQPPPVGFWQSSLSPPWLHWTTWLKLLQIKVSPMEVFPFTYCSGLSGTQLHLWQFL